MSEPSIALQALSALDIVVLEGKEDGSFVAPGDTPEWYNRVFPGGDVDASPFLAEFMALAGAPLDDGSLSQHLYSGPWTERDSAGNACGMEAWITSAGGRRVVKHEALAGERIEEGRRGAAVSQKSGVIGAPAIDGDQEQRARSGHYTAPWAAKREFQSS